MKQNKNLNIRLLQFSLGLLILWALAGCATFSPENVARSFNQCLENGGNYITKVLACDIAINSGTYSGVNLGNLYRMKGVHQQNDGRLYESIASFNQAIQLNPNDSDAYYFRGISEQRIGRPGAAQQDFDMAQQLRGTQGVAVEPPANGEMVEQQALEQQGPGQAPFEQEPEQEIYSTPSGPSPPQVEGWGRPALSRGELIAVMRWIAARVASDRQPYCYRESYGRTAGRPLSACRGNEDKNGALCYPRCNAGYRGVGPVCWQDCPRGFSDIGVSCAKPAAYGRGVGFPWKFGDKLNDKGMFRRCEKRYGRGKCEKFGAIVYPKCKAGYRAFGSNICTPICPSGMRDDGAFCAKHSYGRGVGRPLQCAAGLEQNGALCYPQCKRGFHGVGTRVLAELSRRPDGLRRRLRQEYPDMCDQHGQYDCRPCLACFKHRVGRRSRDACEIQERRKSDRAGIEGLCGWKCRLPDGKDNKALGG